MSNATNTVLSSAPDLPEPPPHLKIFQVSTAGLSFLASTTIALSITCFGNVGLSTPYRRIIFGLSISDMLQSFAFMTGPLAVSPELSGAAGTEATSCRANAFILHLGIVGVLMYTFFLCLYYVQKLKYRVADNSFRHRIETKFHAFIVVFSLTICVIPLEMDAFHTNGTHLSFCNLGNTPTFCEVFPDVVGYCDPTITKRLVGLIYIFAGILPGLCFSGIIISMGLLYHHAYVLNKIIEKECSVPTALRSDNSVEEQGEDQNALTTNEELANEETETPQDRVQKLSRLYRRETTIQATCYVAAFLFTYTPTVVAMGLYLDGFFSPVLDLVSIITYPAGGFLNILVYTRPKIANLRRSHPECSLLQSFWLVLRAGGEIPSEDDLSLSCRAYCCNPEWLVSDLSYSNSHHGQQAPPRRLHLSRMGIFYNQNHS